jgi:hypothetical protein
VVKIWQWFKGEVGSAGGELNHMCHGLPVIIMAIRGSLP